MNFLTRRSALAAGHAAIGLLYVVVLLALWRDDPGIAAENHLMENLQATGLFLALVICLVNLAPIRRKPPVYVTAGMAVFFLTLFLREFETKNLDLPAVLIALASGTGKNVLLGLLWVGALFGVARNRRRLIQDVVSYLRSPLFYYLLAGTVFYLAGEIFDKKLLPMSRPWMFFWEEATECLATLWLFLGASVWTINNIRRQPDDSNANQTATR